MILGCHRFSINDPSLYLKTNHNISKKSIDQLIKNGYSFTKPNTDGIYPLNLLASNPSPHTLEVLKYLIEQYHISILSISADANTVFNSAASNTGEKALEIIDYLFHILNSESHHIFMYSNNPLVNAAMNQSHLAFEIVKKLLNNGLNINRLGANKETALMQACANPTKEGYEITYYLIANHGSLNSLDKNGNNIIHYLVQNNSEQTLNLIKMLKKKHLVNISQKNKNGKTPLEIALLNTGSFSFEIVKYLFYDSVFEKTNNIPLFMEKIFFVAVQNSGTKALSIIQFLMEQKHLQINYQDSQGWTAFLSACNNTGSQSLEIFHLLMKAGASVYYVTNHHQNALDIVAMNPGPFALNMLQFLQKHGLSLFESNQDNKTPLHFAVTNQGEFANALVKYLIAAGVNVFSEDKEGNTALMLAAKNPGSDGYKIVSEIVYSKYQGVIDKKNNNSPILEAAQNTGPFGYQIINFLIQKGFTLEVNDKNGANAFILASQNEGLTTLSIVKHLMRKGTNINLQDKNGNTALYYALLNKKYRYSLIEIFLQKGADPFLRNFQGDNFFTTVKKLPLYDQEIIQQLLKKRKIKINILFN